MAQGTTCADPTVLPGNVSPQACCFSVALALFPPNKDLYKSQTCKFCRCAGLRAASALCRTQVQQIRDLSRQVLYCPAYSL